MNYTAVVGVLVCIRLKTKREIPSSRKTILTYFLLPLGKYKYITRNIRTTFIFLAEYPLGHILFPLGHCFGRELKKCFYTQHFRQSWRLCNHIVWRELDLSTVSFNNRMLDNRNLVRDLFFLKMISYANVSAQILGNHEGGD